MTSRSYWTLIASVGFLVACDAPPQATEPSLQVEALAAPEPDSTETDDCPKGLYKFETECLPEVQFKMMQEAEDAANLAALAGAEDTKQEVEMQQKVIEDQAQQVEKYEKDLEQIKKVIKKKAKGGELKLPPKTPEELERERLEKERLAKKQEGPDPKEEPPIEHPPEVDPREQAPQQQAPPRYPQ